MNSFFYNFSVNFFNLFEKVIIFYKKIKPYFGLTIFWSFYIRGFLLLPYGNIFDTGLFLKIFFFFLFLSVVNYSIFFSLTLKVIENVLSFHWSRKWLSLYHFLSAHLAFFPIFFFFLFMSVALYRSGVGQVDFYDSSALLEVIQQAAREIGRPAFVVFFPLPLSHFLFKAFDWEAVGSQDKVPYNVVFKKPGAKFVNSAILNFIKKLEQQNKLSIYDDPAIVYDSLTQPDKENWLICLYNEVLVSNQALLKKDKWYAPSCIILSPFSKININESNVSLPPTVPNSYLFYLSSGAIRTVASDLNAVSKTLTEHSKSIGIGIAGATALTGAYGWNKDLKLRRADLREKEKARIAEEKWKVFQKEDQINLDASKETMNIIREKYEVCGNKWVNRGSCDKIYADLLTQIERQKKDRLKALYTSTDQRLSKKNYNPLVLEGNEVNPSFLKKIFLFFFNIFF